MVRVHPGLPVNFSMPLYIAAAIIFLFGLIILIMSAKEKSYEMVLGGGAMIIGAIAFFIIIRIVGL